MQKGSSGEVELKKTETLGDAEVPLTANMEGRVKKKKENEATNEGEVETPAIEVETPIEEVKLKKKERKRKNRDENDKAALGKTEATTGDVKTVGDTGATKDGKKRKRKANEVQLNKTETTGDDETPTEQKAKKRKRKAGRDAPADQESNGEEEKKEWKRSEESLENGMNIDGVEVKVDGIENKRKKRKKEKTPADAMDFVGPPNVKERKHKS